MIKIVDVEGLDAFGKTHFCKRLTDDLNKMAPDRTRFIYQHFPDYCSDSGKEIKDLLFNQKNPFSEEAIRYMIELQMRNRLEWWLHSWEKLNANGYDETIIIADRYTASNAIYQFPRLQDPMAEMEYYRKMEYERFHSVIPVFNIFCVCDAELQEERILKRGKVDKYEALEQQRFLRKTYAEMLRAYVYDKNYMWMPLHLLDAEYTRENFFPQWTGESISEELYKVAFYQIAGRFNRFVIKSNRLKLKNIKYKRALKDWYDGYVWNKYDMLDLQEG